MLVKVAGVWQLRISRSNQSNTKTMSRPCLGKSQQRETWHPGLQLLDTQAASFVLSRLCYADSLLSLHTTLKVCNAAHAHFHQHNPEPLFLDVLCFMLYSLPCTCFLPHFNPSERQHGCYTLSSKRRRSGCVAPTQTTYKTRKCLLKGEHCSGMCTGHDSICNTETTPAAYKTRKCSLNGEHCGGMCTGHDSVCNSETNPATYQARKCSLNGKDCSGMCTGHNSVCNSETNLTTAN